MEVNFTIVRNPKQPQEILIHQEGCKIGAIDTKTKEVVCDDLDIKDFIIENIEDIIAAIVAQEFSRIHTPA